jgi:hypothetical protein
MSRPTDDDRIEALRRFLVGLARGDDANQLAAEIADLHVRHNTFPGEVPMELSADALGIAGAERQSHVAYRELLSTHLPKSSSKAKSTGASSTRLSQLSRYTAALSRICSTK